MARQWIGRVTVQLVTKSYGYSTDVRVPANAPAVAARRAASAAWVQLGDKVRRRRIASFTMSLTRVEGGREQD